jgi:putative transcriptional regulator
MFNEFDQLRAGNLIMASAIMLESNFRRTVLLMCEHNEEGSLGFVLNRPLEVRVREAISGFENLDTLLNMGGPVQADTVHYLHTRGDVIDGCHEVIPGVFWGGDKEQLSYLLDSGVINESEIRFFLGYAGWSPGQLEEEFRDGSWYQADATKEIVFGQEYERMWGRVVRSKGGDYCYAANSPEIPGMN